jgi:hypothetical protein
MPNKLAIVSPKHAVPWVVEMNTAAQLSSLQSMRGEKEEGGDVG